MGDFDTMDYEVVWIWKDVLFYLTLQYDSNWNCSVWLKFDGKVVQCGQGKDDASDFVYHMREDR